MNFATPIYPGVDPDTDEGARLNVIAAAFVVLSFITLVLRLISRLKAKVPIGTDDWLIFVAAILSWGYTATVIVEVQQNYFGQHIGKSDAHHLKEFDKGLYGLAITYPLALTFSKLSLLALYWRIFRVTSARFPLQIVASLNIAWMLAAVLVGIFSCIPVQGFWDIMVKSRCIKYPVFFTSNEAFTIALDLVVLLMPVYFIAQLQQSLSHKISISSTFLLGLVATIVSALRLWQLVLAQRKPGYDPTYNDVPAGLWAIVELNLWVVVASIPSLRSLVTRSIHGLRESCTKLRRKQSLPSTDSPKFSRGRHWCGRGAASPKSVGCISGNGASSVSTGPFHKYSINISSGGPRLAGWSALDVPSAADKDLQLQELGGIRVDREIQVT